MPPIKTELLDELLSGVKTPEDLLGDGGVFRQLKKALMERVLSAELTHHLGYEKGASTSRARGNSRNGHSAKTVLTDDGSVDLATPRDPAGWFRRQDHQSVCPRPVGARDPGAPERAVWHRGLA